MYDIDSVYNKFTYRKDELEILIKELDYKRRYKNK